AVGEAGIGGEGGDDRILAAHAQCGGEAVHLVVPGAGGPVRASAAWAYIYSPDAGRGVNRPFISGSCRWLNWLAERGEMS
ncbi:MAG: hypothetical protein KKF33_09605, partial [Alphaproteobacteria bacterium]|nr:hypothetical protein [Alphaproteobacteria bacterium]